ncbi:hypothetical protein [Paenibacillus taichungensis]|uniref:hypothetical protein n=1 Tax=Paenibacillus taichungensis TaxID=484184 RepID=UPI0038CF38EB
MSITKDLGTVVNEFLNTVKVRELKITDKITALEDEASGLELKIKKQSEELVELEIHDNHSGANKLRKSNQELRIQLAEITDTIQGYNAQLDKPIDANSLEKIRLAGAKAMQDRLDRRAAFHKESDELEKRIKELEAKKSNALREWQHAGYNTEIGTLRSILSFVHPDTRKLTFTQQEELLTSWIRGHSIEQYFE